MQSIMMFAMDEKSNIILTEQKVGNIKYYALRFEDESTILSVVLAKEDLRQLHEVVGKILSENDGQDVTINEEAE
ncbi:MAG: hypothetical protein QW734_01160 [Candidatus Bathyarchaeia archaeon]